MKIVTLGFLGLLITDFHSDLKNSNWIQYGGEVNLIKLYKPRPTYWTSSKMPSVTSGAILFAENGLNLQAWVIHASYVYVSQVIRSAV